MSEIYNMYEAKTHLSELVERAAKGETITIAKAGEPQAMLVPVRAKKPKHVPGLGKGKIWYSEDCWAPMNPEELKEWYGGELPSPEGRKK